MDKLDEARREISAVDREMAALFERRMEAVRAVAAYKQEHGLPVLDAAREKAVLEQGAAAIENDELRPYYRRFLQEEMALSKQFQERLLDGLTVTYNGGSYDVHIERGCLDRAGALLNLDRRVLVVTDEGVPPEYAARFAAQCRDAVVVTVPQGEGSKSVAVWQQLLETMLSHGFSRGDCVAAVGGGVPGDLAGFAAASYMRGIDFYNVPTTVLSQVDSSVGGKTAVNLAGVKNIVGAFWQPKAVLIDDDLLQTLPPRQTANGLAEAVKMGLTSDEQLFALFESDDPLAHREEIIARSLAVKIAVVEQDEREAGLRRVLNFGHTIGHGLESLDGLHGLLHGECVALGMLPMCAPKVRERLIPVLQKLNLPTALDFDEDAVCAAMAHDKKSDGDAVTVTVVDEVGSFRFDTVSLASLRQKLTLLKG